MKLTSSLFLLLLWLGASLTARAGISVSNPGYRYQYFGIYYGLGSPAPGKIVYVSVTKPNGVHTTIAQAENVSDYSQFVQLYADQVGTYTFFYEYSYVSQGIPRTTYYTQSYSIASGNSISWGTATATPSVSPPYTSPSISANFYNNGVTGWGPNHYIAFYDYNGTAIYFASVNGAYAGYIGSRSYSPTLPNIGGIGTLTYHLRAVENNVEYFGATKDVPIVVDYAPTCSIAVSASSLLSSQPFTVTSYANDAYGNLTTQTIDYQAPSGTWTYGASPVTRWDGSGTNYSHTLGPVTVPLTRGQWLFHSRSFDSYGQASPAQYQYVSVFDPVTFAFSGGPYIYDGSAKSVSAAPTPGDATYTQSGTWSATVPGTYVATATGNGWFSGSGNYTWTISQASQAISISPASPSVALNGSITFTVSGGAGTGAFVWGGDASGSGSSQTVTFNTLGTRTVTVYRQGDSNYNTSNTATATISVTGSVNLQLKMLRPN